MPQPALPEPKFPELDSMLSRKFGREVANYFSGSPLNRVGFLRPDHVFLSQAIRHPTTSFLLCDSLQPLTKESKKLAYVSHADIQPLIGDNPYEKSENELIEQYNSEVSVPQMIFLGLDERHKDGLVYKEQYKGAPFFAVDVTPKGSHAEIAKKIISDLESRGYSFAQGRVMDIEASEAAIYAEARQLLDWNARNPFCAQCGSPTLSVNAGFKRACPPKDSRRLAGSIGSTTSAVPTPDRPPCSTRTGISNLSFPRTDPTVIMAVVSADGTRILLGRQKKWPRYWYSTLAGFCEPAESVEEAVRREVWEEAGITLGRVVIHSTQPWPYPANLMIGAVGQAAPGGETVDLGNDPELEDARWVPFEEAREALRVGTSGLGDPAPEGYREGDLRLPPSTAIAHQLINAVVNKGFLGADSKI
ncbi:MAG: NADH pyrophosphatase [Bathelium mastoideum]|nr:MAG: NADH pyrophosphatase [Bathelium mastoideum]